MTSVEPHPRSTAQRPRFEDVYARERDYLWKSLRRLGIPERHLEDVAHDVLVVVHRKLSDFDEARPIRPWIFGIAMRTAADFRRSFKNALETPEQDLDPPDDEPRVATPEGALEAREQRALVLRALEALDDDKRAVFVLHELDAEAMPAIAEALSIPLNTAYSRLRAAREEFASAVRRLRGAP